MTDKTCKISGQDTEWPLEDEPIHGAMSVKMKAKNNQVIDAIIKVGNPDPIFVNLTRELDPKTEYEVWWPETNGYKEGHTKMSGERISDAARAANDILYGKLSDHVPEGERAVPTFTINSYGKEHKVWMEDREYRGGALAVQLYEDYEYEGEQFTEPYAVITTNLGDILQNGNHAYVDVNNCPWAEDFLEKNGLAIREPYTATPGFVTYPLYTFTDRFFEACTAIDGPQRTKDIEPIPKASSPTAPEDQHTPEM